MLFMRMHTDAHIGIYTHRIVCALYSSVLYINNNIKSLPNRPTKNKDNENVLIDRPNYGSAKLDHFIDL